MMQTQMKYPYWEKNVFKYNMPLLCWMKYKTTDREKAQVFVKQLTSIFNH